MENNKSATSKDEKPFIKVQRKTPFLYTWDVGTHFCAFCEYHVMEACFECQMKKIRKDEECKTARGVCKHAFHLHCIADWLKTHDVCPFDNTYWEFQKLDQ